MQLGVVVFLDLLLLFLFCCCCLFVCGVGAFYFMERINGDDDNKSFSQVFPPNVHFPAKLLCRRCTFFIYLFIAFFLYMCMGLFRFLFFCHFIFVFLVQ